MGNKFLQSIKASIRTFFMSVLVLGALVSSTAVHGEELVQSIREVYISLDMKNADILDLFKEVESKTAFNFVYNGAELNGVSKISIKTRNKSVAEVLEEISQKAEVSFRQVNQNINVIRSEEKQTRNVEVVLQGTNITGRITDNESGDGLPGVNVVEKGTSNGTITDIDGNFAITVPESATLTISYVGYEAQEISVSGKSVINIALNSDVTQLGEVVVTAYGIEKDTRKLGYAVSKIESVDINRTAAPTLGASLYGKAPGLQIQSTPGGATSGVSLNIRGFASITGNTQPLIVMNGVPIRSGEFNNGNYWGDQRIRGNGLTDLNPADIEDITILKGASAAALYGSEANNGVVLITTKSGRGTKGLGVDFFTSYTNDKIAYLPRYQNVRGPGYPLSYADAGQGLDGFIDDGDGNRYLLNTSVNYGPKFDGQPVRAWTGEIVPYSASNSSYADLFQDANSQQTNIALSAANEKANMRLSYTRQDNQMISFGSKNERNVFNLNTSFNLADWTKTDIAIQYINQNTHNRPYKVDRMINNFTGMMDRFEKAEWYFDRYQTSLGYRFRTGSQASATPDENITYGPFRGDIADYVWRVNKFTSDERNNRIIASITETIQFTDFLSLRGRLANDFTSEKIQNETPNNFPLVIGNSGGFSVNQNTLSNLYGDVLLTFDKDITEDLSVSAMGGYSARVEEEIYQSAGTNGGLATENYFDLSSSVNQPNVGLSRVNRVNDAFIGTVSLNFKNYLNLEGTVRRDRFSTMNPNNNSFVYPSVNSGFVFSDLFDLPPSITFGKLRASYGVVGNYPGVYAANVAYTQRTLGDQGAGVSPLYTTLPTGTFGNDLIRPEQKHEIELGLNMRFFRNRIGFDFAYYNAQIRDQILPLDIAQSTGTGAILTNIGTLRNQGLELALDAQIFNGSAFKWDVMLNLARNTNKVEKLANNSTELIHANYDGNAAEVRSVVGRPMGDIYTHPVATDANGNKIVQDDGLYQLDGDEWVVSGNAMPDLIGGLLNNLSYKGFSLNITTDFSFGSSIMPTGIYWMISRGLLEESLNGMDAEHGGLTYYQDANGKGVQTTAATGPNGETVFDDGILLEGVLAGGEPNTNVIPNMLYYAATYNWGGPQYGSSRYELYVQKNNYIKMRELSLGYTLPQSISQKIGARNVSISVFGRNLFFIYRTIKDLDAEQTTSGTRWYQNINTAGNNPAFRSMGLTLRASF
ncbi:MAG: SusC/RagA family TonB-linked outer membrane protein [Bacteroidota bacterium]